MRHMGHVTMWHRGAAALHATTLHQQLQLLNQVAKWHCPAVLHAADSKGHGMGHGAMGAPADVEVLLDGWCDAIRVVHCAPSTLRTWDVGDVNETVGPWFGRRPVRVTVVLCHEMGRVSSESAVSVGQWVGV